MTDRIFHLILRRGASGLLRACRDSASPEGVSLALWSSSFVQGKDTRLTT